MPWASSSSPKPEKHEQPQSHSVTFNPNFGVIQFTGGTPISSKYNLPLKMMFKGHGNVKGDSYQTCFLIYF